MGCLRESVRRGSRPGDMVVVPEKATGRQKVEDLISTAQSLRGGPTTALSRRSFRDSNE